MSRKKVLLAVLAAIVVLAFVASFFRKDSGNSIDEIAFSDVVAAAHAGRVQQITSGSRELTVQMRGESGTHRSYVGTNTDAVQVLEAAGVSVGTGDAPRVSYSKPAEYGDWLGVGLSYSVTIAYLIILYFTLRNATREGFRRALAMARANNHVAEEG